jgi:hypothetical protein
MQTRPRAEPFFVGRPGVLVFHLARVAFARLKTDALQDSARDFPTEIVDQFPAHVADRVGVEHDVAAIAQTDAAG